MLERTPETVKTLTVGAANTPYKSLIVPIIFVTFIVFGPAVTSATQTVLKASNVEQPKLSSSTETAMQILKWVPLETHRGKHVCKLVKKCLTYTVPHFFVIISPPTGMSFPELRDRVITLVSRNLLPKPSIESSFTMEP